MEDFKFSNFISHSGIFSSLFDSSKNFWEVIPQIEIFIKEFRNNLPQGYREIKDNIFVGENVLIDDLARIEGGAIIGSNSSVGHAAFIRGGVLMGENVHIGHAVEVKHSIILDNSAIAHLNYIGDSIVGNNVNVGGGSILANWRFDVKSIAIRKNDEKIDTGLVKFGSIIGDNSKIGVNAVLNPGTVLGKNSIVYPLKSVSGFYPADSIVKA